MQTAEVLRDRNGREMRAGDRIRCPDGTTGLAQCVGTFPIDRGRIYVIPDWAFGSGSLTQHYDPQDLEVID